MQGGHRPEGLNILSEVSACSDELYSRYRLTCLLRVTDGPFPRWIALLTCPLPRGEMSGLFLVVLGSAFRYPMGWSNTASPAVATLEELQLTRPPPAREAWGVGYQ